MAQNFAYVGCRTTKERDARGEGIAVYEIAPDNGEWRYVGTAQAGDNPSFLLVSQAHQRLYTVHGDGSTVSCFYLNASSGMPEYEETISCHGENPVHLCLDRQQNNLLIVNYASGNVARIELDQQGKFHQSVVLTEFPAVSGPHKVEQQSSHPHFIGRFINNLHDTDWYIVPDKGSDTLYALQYEDSHVINMISGKSRESAAPRHAVMHPYRPFIYVVNELDSTLTTWKFAPEAEQLIPVHTLSIIPPQHHALTRASGIAITADGEMIYLSNRGHNSISLVRIDPLSGMPVSVSWESSQGNFPRFLCLSDDDQYLYVANERSDSIVQFRVNKDKTLQPTGQLIETGSPVSLAFYQPR